VNLGTTRDRMLRFFEEFCVPFWLERSSFEKVVLILTALPLIPFLVRGDIFKLFSALNSIIKGHEIDLAGFIVLLGETFLILYSLILFINYNNKRRSQFAIKASPYLTHTHHCIVVKKLIVPNEGSQSYGSDNKMYNNVLNNQNILIEEAQSIDDNNLDYSELIEPDEVEEAAPAEKFSLLASLMNEVDDVEIDLEPDLKS